MEPEVDGATRAGAPRLFAFVRVFGVCARVCVCVRVCALAAQGVHAWAGRRHRTKLGMSLGSLTILS